MNRNPEDVRENRKNRRCPETRLTPSLETALQQSCGSDAVKKEKGHSYFTLNFLLAYLRLTIP